MGMQRRVGQLGKGTTQGHALQMGCSMEQAAPRLPKPCARPGHVPWVQGAASFCSKGPARGEAARPASAASLRMAVFSPDDQDLGWEEFLCQARSVAFSYLFSQLPHGRSIKP